MAPELVSFVHSLCVTACGGVSSSLGEVREFGGQGRCWSQVTHSVHVLGIVHKHHSLLSILVQLERQLEVQRNQGTCITG